MTNVSELKRAEPVGKKSVKKFLSGALETAKGIVDDIERIEEFHWRNIITNEEAIRMGGTLAQSGGNILLWNYAPDTADPEFGPDRPI